MTDEKESYREMRLMDLVDTVMGDAKTYPDGMDTVVVSGDFECNYTHRKHEFQWMRTDRGVALVMAYEMHEGEN